jgi:hypothetical protein
MANPTYFGATEAVEALDAAWTQNTMVAVLLKYLSTNGHHRVVAAYEARKSELITEGLSG